MRVISLASSSKGNAAIVQVGESSWLIDCGISMKKIMERLAHQHALLADIDGVIITHEHQDHIRGLGPFLRRYQKPCYAAPKTLACLRDGRLGNHIETLLKPFPEAGLERKNVHIVPIPLSHDAAEPIGLHFHDGVHALTMLTDTGCVNDDMLEYMAESDLVFLEANHDPQLLKQGPYPESLKRRIASDYGHLSNQACGVALRQIVSAKTKHIMLAHLSEQNNTLKHAQETVVQHLVGRGALPKGLRLSVAAPEAVRQMQLNAKKE